MATQTIYTDNDTYADENSPDTTKGTGGGVAIEADTGYENIGYIGFDISSGPSSSLISSVIMHYHDHLGAANGWQGLFRRTTSSWSETSLTWNNQPTNTSTNETYCQLPDAWSWGSGDITNLYKDAKDAGNVLGIRIQKPGAASTLKYLSTKEYSSGTYKAYIVITYSVGTDYYVKTTGNDLLAGDSWANAWKTINKAATTVADGVTVHIGFGTYDAEPAANKIAPQNVGATGIYYLPETATTGGGTGTVSVEQNT